MKALLLSLGLLSLVSCSTPPQDAEEMQASNSLTKPPVRLGKEFTNSIRNVFMENEKALQDCYKEVLKTEPKLKGKCTLDFIFNSQGAVTQTAIARDKTHWVNGDGSRVEQCILPKLKQWKFPQPIAPAQEIQVFYPLKFSI